MSLEGGFDEVDESFFSRAFSVSSCAILRFQLHDLGLQRRNRRFNQPGNLLLRESSWHSPVITDADTKCNTTLGGLAVNAYGSPRKISLGSRAGCPWYGMSVKSIPSTRDLRRTALGMRVTKARFRRRSSSRISGNVAAKALRIV